MQGKGLRTSLDEAKRRLGAQSQNLHAQASRPALMPTALPSTEQRAWLPVDSFPCTMLLSAQH